MTLHHGDCLDVMAGMDPESVDAIVTDPPYGLEFMGMAWDQFDGRENGTPRPRNEWGDFGSREHARGQDDAHRVALKKARALQTFSGAWAEAAYRVAKPSAYLLAFGGTRTVHRMTVALEDAGWIIRDMLVWAYACLSDDTEVLTSEGWVPYNRANVGQLAAAFDPDSGELRWSPIEAVHVYHHEGDMAEVGPSLVTLNHRVVIDQTSARVPRVPGLRDPFREAVGVGQEGSRAGLLEGVQRQAAYPGSEVPPWSTVVGGPEGARVRGYDGSQELGLEGRRYRVQEARELLGRPLRAESGVGAPDGPQGRVRHGAPPHRGGPDWLPAHPDGVREPRGPRPDEQRSGEPDALAGQPDAQALRVGQVPDRDGEPDTVRLVPYAGVVWCITVSTGAFVARRNGVAFVTGNSGFPKSKASLKPAWEPIVMARKPGPLRMLAIDECRIPSEGHLQWAEPRDMGYGRGTDNGAVAAEVNPAGRWPANVVLTDAIFDGGVEGVVGGGETSVLGHYRDLERTETRRSYVYVEGEQQKIVADKARYAGDSGTYSRFFLIPKAARADREPVLGGLPKTLMPWTGGALIEGRTVNADGTITNHGDTRKPRSNVHPTVKPVDLMRHLVRLVTPTGGTVLDPFLGSGTTALAAEMEGFAWIGIEREAEYVAIAEARLNGTQRGLGLEVEAPTPRMPNTHPDLSKHQPKRRSPSESYSGGWGATGTPPEDDVA